jgi:hypothetical protein
MSSSLNNKVKKRGRESKKEDKKLTQKTEKL